MYATKILSYQNVFYCNKLIGFLLLCGLPCLVISLALKFWHENNRVY